MDMKKVLVLGLFLVVAVSTLAAISAAEEITLEGIKFKIPDGYAVSDKDSDSSKTNDIEHVGGIAVDKEMSTEYKNSAGEELELKVGTKNNQKIDSINPTGAEKKQIAGKDGFLIKENDDGKTKYKFLYVQDGKIVKIDAVSEDVIAKVIV